MNDKIMINNEVFSTETFRGTVETLRFLGVPISDHDSLIEVKVYDYIAGEIIMPTVEMDEFNAVRVFGHLTVNGISLEDGRMSFTLNSADCEAWNGPIKQDK